MEISYTQLLNYGALIITQFAVGKKGSFVYALLMHMNLYLVSLVIVLSDIFLMFFVGKLFDASARFFPFNALHHRAERLEQKMQSSTLARRLGKIGTASVLVLTATPFAGGVWSGMILAKTLHIQNSKAYWLTGIGSVIGCAIFFLAAEGLIELL